ncbi:MAG: Enoyl-CoA hydratase, partial [uncultured Microvirga sp.]
EFLDPAPRDRGPRGDDHAGPARQAERAERRHARRTARCARSLRGGGGGARRGADRRGEGVLLRPGPHRGASARAGRQNRSRPAAGAGLQSAGPATHELSKGDHRGPERAGGRRLDEHRAVLRPRGRGPLCLSSGGVLPDRPHPGRRRHLDPAPHHWAEARARPDADRRPGLRRRGAAHGAGLPRVRRRELRGRDRGAGPSDRERSGPCAATDQTGGGCKPRQRSRRPTRAGGRVAAPLRDQRRFRRRRRGLPREAGAALRGTL